MVEYDLRYSGLGGTGIMTHFSRFAILLIASTLNFMAAATNGNAEPSVFRKQLLEDTGLQLVTFWGEPYPFGYVYHRPSMRCWERREVEGFFEHHYEMVWVCGDQKNGVTARY